LDLLERIVAAKQAAVATLRPRLPRLRAAAAAADPPRPFAAALRRPAEVALIAEFKRRSPSAGWIREGGEPAAIGAAYQAAGAAAVSVLTDETFFGGSLEHLAQVRWSVTLPVLRKDFVIDESQVWEARAAGADALLLIVRILEDALLRDLRQLGEELGMGVLVEVHDAVELERALRSGAGVVGVNNRDLATFRTELGTSVDLAALVPAGVVLVAESGIGSAADVDALGRAGVDAILVGESLMRQAHPGAAAGALVGRPRRERR
jgi:indole-3-glycerol phosphate synthase